ncbi:hypothetical protein [Paenibacillus sp. V4I7]|uniref:hypothetical protein n=1 Tax=Paenibacillus sp. V4I7 TaxID=3042307 RepID=UPI0027836C71|nr:hypothetical protein [Paenibacillus sp. V4I7]MDQ0902745.1 hypothetical protein [Paenibacillus sp. V4I7]
MPGRPNLIPIQQKLEIEKFCSESTLSAKLLNAHPLVHDTLQYKRARKESTRPASANCLDVNTSDEQFERALKIFDAVLKAIEKFGGIIKNKQRETKICVGREEVKIGIKEKRKQMLHEKTKEELKSEARSGYSWAPKFDYIQTGYLHFFIDEWYAPRKNWNDIENKKIEQSISDIVVAIFETAEKLRLVRIEREEAENRRRQAELERRKIIELREQELLRIQDLEDRANDYQKAELIRKYILALSVKQQGILDQQERDDLECYILWAQQKAAWLDPFINNDDPLLGKRRK